MTGKMIPADGEENNLAPIHEEIGAIYKKHDVAGLSVIMARRDESSIYMDTQAHRPEWSKSDEQSFHMADALHEWCKEYAENFASLRQRYKADLNDESVESSLSQIVSLIKETLSKKAAEEKKEPN